MGMHDAALFSSTDHPDGTSFSVRTRAGVEAVGVHAAGTLITVAMHDSVAMFHRSATTAGAESWRLATGQEVGLSREGTLIAGGYPVQLSEELSTDLLSQESAASSELVHASDAIRYICQIVGDGPGWLANLGGPDILAELTLRAVDLLEQWERWQSKSLGVASLHILHLAASSGMIHMMSCDTRASRP